MYKRDFEIAQVCTMQPITEIAKVADVDETGKITGLL